MDSVRNRITRLPDMHLLCFAQAWLWNRRLLETCLQSHAKCMRMHYAQVNVLLAADVVYDDSAH